MLVLKTGLTLEDNSTCAFRDTTGQLLSTAYGQSGNIAYADVKGIRLKIGNYTTVTYPAPPTANGFIQYTEYQKIGGSPEVINNKLFVAGDYFVPQFTGLTSSQLNSWQTTGYYVYPYLNSWLPNATEVPLDITVTQLGQSGSDIEDNEYIDEYEVYYSEINTTAPAVVGVQYLVLGLPSNLNYYVTYGGHRYYAGEVFIGANTTNIVPHSASFVQLYAATTAYATMVYAIETGLNDLIEQQMGKGNQDLVNYTYGEIIKISTKLQSLMYSSKTTNVSLLYCWETIQYLSARINQLLIP
jgi:hypothetical protein